MNRQRFKGDTMYRTAQGSAFLLACLFLCSCKGSISPFHANPSTVTQTFYMSCNVGDYSKAKSTLSPDADKLIDGELGALSGGIKGVCDKMTRSGELVSVEVIRQSERGEGADVTSKLHFKDGSTSEDHEPLIKVNGDWKITSGN